MDLALLNGWRVFAHDWAKPRARMFQGTVYLEGLIKNDNPVPGLIATLPIEFRPKSANMIFTANENTQGGRIDVYSNGNIYMRLKEENNAYALISLNDVVYRV